MRKILLFGLLIIAVSGEESKAPLGVGDEGVKVDTVSDKDDNAGRNASSSNSVPKTKPNSMTKTKSKELMSRPITSVVWTQEKEPKIHKNSGKNGKPIAFRDLVVEKTGARIFARFMEKVQHPTEYSNQVLRDPMLLRQGIDMKKKSSLFDIHLKTDHMMIRGFHKLKLTYIRVIRHFGLRDIKVHLRMGADMKIEGHYNLQGQALSFLPVTGDGNFQITLSGCSLSALSFIHLDHDELGGEERLVIKELETSIDYNDVKFEFKNMMGGGAVGSAVNMVINTMGEAIVDSQKLKIVSRLKETFREQVSEFI